MELDLNAGRSGNFWQRAAVAAAGHAHSGAATTTIAAEARGKGAVVALELAALLPARQAVALVLPALRRLAAAMPEPAHVAALEQVERYVATGDLPAEVPAGAVGKSDAAECARGAFSLAITAARRAAPELLSAVAKYATNAHGAAAYEPLRSRRPAAARDALRAARAAEDAAQVEDLQ